MNEGGIRRDALREELWGFAQHGQGLLLTGAPGVGKTQLAHDLLAMATDRGWSTQLIVATSAVRSVSFGAVHELLSTEELDNVALMNLAIEQLAERARGRQQLIVVDDINSLDADSMALVDRLARGSSATVVATVRSTDMDSDRLRPLWKDEVLQSVEVHPLLRDETDHLLRSMLDGQVHPELAEAVWELTEGNALFVRELILGARGQGKVARDQHGAWTLMEPLASTNRLFGIISSRLATLDEPERDGMVIVACSEPIPLMALDGVVSLATLEALESDGFISVHRGGRGDSIARVAHPMIGEVLREGFSKVRRRALLGQLASSMLQKAASLDPDNRQRALLWALDAGANFDYNLLLPAAERALFRFDANTAAKLAEPGLDFVPTSRAAQILCRSLMLTKRHDEAALSAQRGLTLAENEEERCGLLVAWADNEMHGRADPASGIIRLEHELPTFTDINFQAEILMRIVVGKALLGEPLSTIKVADSYIADEGFPYSARIHILAGVVYAMSMTARVGPTFRKRLADGKALTNDDLEHWIHNFLLQLLTLVGDVQECELIETVRRAGVEASAAVDASEVGGWRITAALAAAVAGGGTEAAEAGEAASSCLEISDPFGVWLWVEGIAALGYARQGNFDAAQVAIDRGRDDEQAAQGRLASFLRMAEAWQLLHRGKNDAAVQAALRGANDAASEEHFFFAAVAAHEVVRLGRADLVVDELEEWAEASEASLLDLYARHARARVDADISVLGEVAGRFWAMGAPAIAAETYLVGSDLTADQTERNLLLARSQAAATEARWKNAPTMANASFLLSERELQVARGAAQGKTNREVGAELYLSYRTVGNHLQTVYRKLRISDRSELAAYVLSDRETALIIDAP